jgi:hypothetical protein
VKETGLPPAEREDHYWNDEAVQILLDDGGDEITYYEFGFTPQNSVYTLFNFIPTAPMDYNPWQRYIGLPNWDPRGLRSAVCVDGTVEQVSQWRETPAKNRDRGYVVDVAIPWESFRTSTTPGGLAMRRTVWPQPGERWRLGLFRVECPRVPRDVAQDSTTIRRTEARQRIVNSGAAFDQLVADGKLLSIDDKGDAFLLL